MIKDLGSDYRKSPKGVYIACGCSCCCCLHSVVAAGYTVYGLNKAMSAVEEGSPLLWVILPIGTVAAGVACFMTMGGGQILAVALLLPVILFVGSILALILSEVGLSISDLVGFESHAPQRAVVRVFFKKLIPATLIGMLVSPLGLLPLLLLK